MRGWWLLAAALVGAVWFMNLDSPAGDTDAKKLVRKPFGLEKRVPWTTSKVVGSPEPPLPYKIEPAFPKLPKFAEPFDLTHAPGTNRLFVAEHHGKIYSFFNNKDVAQADLAVEFLGARDSKGQPTKQPILAITFHPKFIDNGYLFVTLPGLPKGSRVSRFTVKGEPPVIDLASEKIIFEWPSGGHSGGCLRFGPDGYLYLATGDGSWMADELNIGQDLSSVLGKLLRIDVDNPPPGKAYGIPQDNPFVNTQGARPEVYAYGFRQMWRFSFDRGRGPVACLGADRGQRVCQMVHALEKGGNYGWSVREGIHTFRPERAKGPTEFLTPIVEHAHSDFHSITGGFIYRGKRLKELEGFYIFGDSDAGSVWTFAPAVVRDRRTGKNVIRAQAHHELARTSYRLMSFGEDAAGEIYFVDSVGGGVYQLAKTDQKRDNSATFPRKLSETGIFASTRDHVVAPGVIPYSVNSPLWGDHASKERFLAIPGAGQIGFNEITYPQPSPGAPPGWRFPEGTVLVKTFSMDMERGNPSSRKRLETRLLHFQQFPGTADDGARHWRGYTYVWNAEQTDAELLDEKGADKLLKIKVGDKLVEQNYRFPSRTQCTFCHTVAAKFALGVNTMQMNRDHNYGGVIANQLATLEHIGLFTKKLPAPFQELPKLADFNDATVPIEVRARAYLHSNCSHCHTKWGNEWIKMLSTLAIEDLGIVNVNPETSFGIKDAKILTPGYPEKSIIHHRISITGLGRMPFIGSRVVDDTGVQLIHDWIKTMK